MKALSGWVLALVFCCGAAGQEFDLSKPLAALALPDGRILRGVTFKEFKTQVVVLSTAGGPVVVRYEFLPDEIRAAAENKRPGGSRWLAGKTIADKDATTLRGQVFVTTQGNGSYKFGEVTVYAFPLYARTAWDRRENPVLLPYPLATTTTDGDGKFTLRIPKNTPYLLFAQATRRLSSVDVQELEWRVASPDVRDPQDISFGTGEWLHTWRPVKIEPAP